MDPQARAMNYSAMLIVAVLLLLAAAVPIWRHSRPWGYVPSVVIFLILVVLVALAIGGRL
jgi:hypothetical protein